MDVADGTESSVNETIAKALWLSSMHAIDMQAASKSNLRARHILAGPLPDRPRAKFNMYATWISTFPYELHRDFE
jgi:hypothetical protein